MISCCDITFTYIGILFKTFIFRKYKKKNSSLIVLKRSKKVTTKMGTKLQIALNSYLR